MITLRGNLAGASSVVAALRAYPRILDAALDDVIKTLRNLARGGTPVGVGSTSGATKRSWGPIEHEDGGLSFSLDVPWAEVLERGLYPGVGPRTVQTSEGIFSRQAPEGILSPMVEDEEVQRKIAGMVVSELERRLAGAGA